MAFFLGDLVQSTSGGPVMTVSDTSGQDVWVRWFDDNNHPAKDVFKENTLKKHEVTARERINVE